MQFQQERGPSCTPAHPTPLRTCCSQAPQASCSDPKVQATFRVRTGAEVTLVLLLLL